MTEPPARPSEASDAPSLSLVIPAFNEAARLDAGFARLQAAIAAGAITPSTTQFVVVDDGSDDDTANCARSLFSVFPHSDVVRLPENRGKGAAVRAGVAASRGAAIVFADADMAIDPVQTPLFMAALELTDLAIGSRAASGASVDRPSLRRSIMNRTFNHLVNTLTHVALDDTQCGFKAFRGPAARLLFHCSTTDRMAFDVELLTLARRLGLSITQIPVHWLRVEGSRVRSVADSASMVRDVLGAKRRLATIPALPAIRLSVAEERLGHPGALASISQILPVLAVGPAESLVLLPLLTPDAVTSQVAAFEAQWGAAAVHPTTLSGHELLELAPLSSAWGATAIASPHG